MFLLISAGLFAVFIANVVIGATGGTIFLTDVGEMLLLFAASVFFVAAVLKREAERDNNE